MASRSSNFWIWVPTPRFISQSTSIRASHPWKRGSQTGLETSPTGENAGPELGSGSGETTYFATTSTGWSIKSIGETAAGFSALKPK
jgi:hypothetical protein